MQPLSNDRRKRILDALDNREGSRRRLAARFKVNTSTVTRPLRIRRRTGSFGPGPHGGGVEPTLDHLALERLGQLVEETPDATLATPKQRPGVSGSRMTIGRAVQGLGLPLKKKSRHAAGRDTPEVRKERREFRKQADPIEPRRLAFADETGVTTAMTPSHGRAPRGERVEVPAPASWESAAAIAAMGLDGVRAPLAFPGAVNAATFLGYVEQVLVPAPPEGDVVAFDTPSSHLGPAVFEAIERAGAGVPPPPPYSPDSTPIEEMSSKFKGSLRRVGARAKEHLHDAIGEGLREVTAPAILGWFRHAGLCATHS